MPLGSENPDTGQLATGTPYEWGDAEQKQFDCSELVSSVAAALLLGDTGERP